MASHPAKRTLTLGVLTLALAASTACGGNGDPNPQKGVEGRSTEPTPTTPEVDVAEAEDETVPAPEEFVDSHADHNCSDFSRWREAQEYFESMDGDPDALDRDGNGIACEELR